MRKITRILLTECDDNGQSTLRVEFAGQPDYKAGERMLQAALDEVRRQRLELMAPEVCGALGGALAMPANRARGLLT